MDTLHIESTSFTPEIMFNQDTLIFEISGISRPEDVILFYEPVLEWLDMFYEGELVKKSEKYSGNSLKVIFNFVYFNSASAKYILRILDRIEKMQQKGLVVQIDWYYDLDDEQMREDGEDLSEAVEIPFQFIPR